MRNVQDSDVLAKSEQKSTFGRLLLAAVAAVLVVIVDQLTKQWAVNRLTPGSCDVPGSCIDLILGAKFHLLYNRGAAFSTGTGFGPIIGVLAIAMTVGLLFAASQRKDRLGTLVFGAIAGGAIGNVIDRAFRASGPAPATSDGFLSGAVVDFVDLGWWPVFNVADVAIVGGVIIYMVMAFTENENPEIDDEAKPAGDV